jgi:hypothetical protein
MSRERYADICRKVEDAFKALIEAERRDELAAVTVATGFTSAEVVLPCIRIICPDCTMEIVGSELTGNWFVDLQISVASNYGDTTRANKSSMAALLFDILLTDDLVTRLNNSGVNDVQFYGDEDNPASLLSDIKISRLVDEHTHIERLTASVYCAPSRQEEDDDNS